ncbi:hypothetical protein BD413DRAFT_33494 [Trametes elegans]|nr:hypothetical protein BD413DRAFT_33494 [Trametes elegans]
MSGRSCNPKARFHDTGQRIIRESGRVRRPGRPTAEDSADCSRLQCREQTRARESDDMPESFIALASPMLRRRPAITSHEGRSWGGSSGLRGPSSSARDCCIDGSKRVHMPWTLWGGQTYEDDQREPRPRVRYTPLVLAGTESLDSSHRLRGVVTGETRGYTFVGRAVSSFMAVSRSAELKCLFKVELPADDAVWNCVANREID